MTTLADDIETLREERGDVALYVAKAAAPLDRVIAILEPLAGLDDEQLDFLITMNGHGVEPYRALAVSLTALRGKR